MRIYVASSWRNEVQPGVVRVLRDYHEVYDFRTEGFGWAEIDFMWERWSNFEYLKALENPLAEHGYERDFLAMSRAEAFVLVMPCGRSAHLELGWAIGAGKPSCILLSSKQRAEPELMYKMASLITDDITMMQEWSIKVHREIHGSKKGWATGGD